MSKPCEYCGHDLPFGVDKKTRQIRSHHFTSCEVRLSEKLQESALEAKDVPVGSFMTRLQAIDFLLKMRPQTEPTEKQIIATIDAYSALFGDMIESPTPPQRKPLTDEEIMDALKLKSCDGYRAIVRAIEAAHQIYEDKK